MPCRGASFTGSNSSANGYSATGKSTRFCPSFPGPPCRLKWPIPTRLSEKQTGRTGSEAGNWTIRLPDCGSHRDLFPETPAGGNCRARFSGKTSAGPYRTSMRRRERMRLQHLEVTFRRGRPVAADRGPWAGLRMERKDKPVALENTPVEYAPAHEPGVVFLLAHVARRR